MPVRISKAEAYDLYNIISYFVLGYEEQIEIDYPEDILDKVKNARILEKKIQNAYQSVDAGGNVFFKLSAEEALFIVQQLITNIQEHEELSGVIDDPISYNAERAYNVNILKECIQKHFIEKFHELWNLDER